MVMPVNPLGVPNPAAPFVDPATGVLTPIWYGFISRLGVLAANAAAPAPVTLGLTPASWTAPYRGHLFLSGGSVALLRLTRGTVTVPVGLAYAPLPMLAGDVATITYGGVAPVARFVSF